MLFIRKNNSLDLIKGILWVLTWEICYVITMSSVKLLTPQCSSAKILFMRSLFGCMVLIPIFIKQGLKEVRTQKPLFHMLRVLFGCLTIIGTYYSYRNLPMTTAASIGFISSLITPILATFFLNDKASFKKWLVILLGYLGVIIILYPSPLEAKIVIYVALATSFAASCTVICLKKLTLTETTFSMIFYNNIAILCLSTGAIIWEWDSKIFVNITDSLLLFCIGIIAIFSQFCYIKALNFTWPSFLAAFEYSRLLLLVLSGYIIFKEIPNFREILGAVIIITTTFCITYLEHTRFCEQKSTEAL